MHRSGDQFSQQIVEATQRAERPLTVEEIMAETQLGEMLVRRYTMALTAMGVLRESFRHTPGRRGSKPRTYHLPHAEADGRTRDAAFRG